MTYISFLVSAAVTFLAIKFILSSRFVSEIQDIPNERSLHSTPTPRTGGVGVMAGVLSGWAIISPTLTWWILLPLVLLIIISLLDDMYGLPISQRLVVHMLAAAILTWGSNTINAQGILMALVVMLSTVWMINLYNFMDGANGLAGGMALFGFVFYGIAALLSHDNALALMNFVIAASALAFLTFNFHQAKIFLGDAGSIPLGFLAAAVGVWGWMLGYWTAWFPLLVFSPFIVDASATLLKRKIRGAKVTEAHREHYYQRVIQMGWSHRRLALVEYFLMFCCGTLALLTLGNIASWIVIVSLCFVYGGLMLWVEIAWRGFDRGRHAEG